MRGENYYRNIFRILYENFVGLNYLAVVSESESALTRFANSQIHQNVSEKKSTLTMLVTKDNKVVCSTTNDLTINGLKALKARLEAMLENATPLDYQFKLPDLTVAYPVENVDESVKNASAETRAGIFDKILSACGNDVQAFGYIEDEITEICVVSSNGMFLYQAGSKVSFNFVPLKDSASGYVSSCAKGYKDLNLEEKIKRAVEFARMSVNPVEIDPGTYTVILGPEAVADLFTYFVYACTNGYMHELGMSSSVKFLGQKIGPDELNVFDDPYHPDQIPLSFDMCGKKRERIPIIENGVFKNVLYPYGAALRFGKKPTGHTISLENMDYAMAPNLVVAAGSQPLEEMLASTESGIFVNTFHYMNVVDPHEAIFTGMTRHGTFLIEKGKLTKPIKNMRFNIKFFDFAKNLIAISKETETVAGSYFPIVAPYMKVANFNFTSKTA
ncbi:TldD/PmbA family protein [Pseudothermotoga thermarum]|uniref:Peptidase U62 modulator of DNA gyrase n=1 Tax=Pseudothermotoga thermarum DSM 5069 TaxID=688269 RepID=F7YWK6_9THEM|nr:TldD/PmbA family protein [Pseudothermotoga thermarum]AEH51987.1 peptidase U62 modulator of DNA gyrase [Pseudothermotoga thermarum DSM 5069]